MCISTQIQIAIVLYESLGLCVVALLSISHQVHLSRIRDTPSDKLSTHVNAIKVTLTGEREKDEKKMASVRKMRLLMLLLLVKCK